MLSFFPLQYQTNFYFDTACTTHYVCLGGRQQRQALALLLNVTVVAEHGCVNVSSVMRLKKKPHCSHVPQLPETTATTTEVTISKFHEEHTSVRQQAHYKLIWLVLQTRTLCLIQQQEHDRSLCLNLQTRTLCLLVLQFGLSSD